MGKKNGKKKYYVVWRGFRPGIYHTWEACKEQINGYERAQYKSFSSLEEARAAFEKSYEEIRELKGKKNLHELTTDKKPILNSLSVDAACKGNPGILEFRGVYTDTGTEIFRRGPYDQGTVNIGEFLAIVLALAWLKKNKLVMPVYSDSRTAIAWVRKKQVNTKLKWTKKNEELLKAVHGALRWLKENDYSNIPILKWETRLWGEIPADYGRK
ncbi:ribonuclease H family protein [Candidatus Sulfidibacterium hydrothermale]|uniref:ribonuclease H1 domain-containing protein n=1 Tax=Candidatus Sulfidibacterium hydrothermale TaxID=2875962 RepID=UPI001F0A222F|nr:ribonuclease H family protein [Candidatus Sulfidibacterium hydrothermale]UBM62659.1 ribonuclease H family protein [Candidatus Sulfidibacterium hydrothermale]